MATSAIERAGLVLFRLRSLTPIPVVGLVAWLVWRRHDDAVSVVHPMWGLELLGLGLALLGQALRFFTLGWVPEGTSGQGFALEASTLNTRGPYAVVRNPLYLGNLGIVSGLLCMTGSVAAAAVGLGFFFFEYFFIIRAEETFLREKFGEAFEAWASRVSRWVPSFPAQALGRLREGGFDAWRALRKEHNPFTAWSLGALALHAWNRHTEGALSPLEAQVLLALAAAVLVFFATTKFFKRRWYRLRRSQA